MKYWRIPHNNCRTPYNLYRSNWGKLELYIPTSKYIGSGGEWFKMYKMSKIEMSKEYEISEEECRLCVNALNSLLELTE